MESYLEENFGGVKGKNPKRRFRFTADLDKRGEVAAIERANQERLRAAVLVSKSALDFIHGLKPPGEHVVPEQVNAAGFQICTDVVEDHTRNKVEGGSGISDASRERVDIKPASNALEHILLDGSAEPTNLPLALLRHITEDFADKQLIGRGAFADVYKGDLQNGSVAVKRLLNCHRIEEEPFYREATFLISVKHRNIVRFLGYCANIEKEAMIDPKTLKYVFGEIRERLLCFEYIKNGSLEKYLTDELRGLEWHMRYQIIQGICSGLVYLHREKGIVHRDMKPENILLDDHMIPKITDFGISTLLDGATHAFTSNSSGTIGYRSPELIHHGRVSIRSDIYSLGVIINELVTGRKDKPDINHVLRKWRHRWNKSGKYPPLGYEQVTKCIDIALRCVSDSPNERPYIWEIISMLNGLESRNDHMKNADESLVAGPISPYPWEMLEFDKLELDFPFEMNKQIPCSLELTNVRLRCVQHRTDRRTALLRRAGQRCGVTAIEVQCQGSIASTEEGATFYDMQGRVCHRAVHRCEVV